MTIFELLGLNTLFAMGAALIYTIIQVLRDPPHRDAYGEEWEMLQAWAVITTLIFFWPLAFPVWALSRFFKALGNYASKRKYPDA